jgi:hypothetical protein
MACSGQGYLDSETGKHRVIVTKRKGGKIFVESFRISTISFLQLVTEQYPRDLRINLKYSRVWNSGTLMIGLEIDNVSCFKRGNPEWQFVIFRGIWEVNDHPNYNGSISAALTAVLNSSRHLWSTFWGHPAHFVVKDSLAQICTILFFSWHIWRWIWDHRCSFLFSFSFARYSKLSLRDFRDRSDRSFLSRSDSELHEGPDWRLYECHLNRKGEPMTQTLPWLLRTSPLDTLPGSARPRRQFGLYYRLCS